VAVPLASVGAEQVIEVSQAVIRVQRDHGDRSNRRHARLKYLIADRGLAWFREQVQAYVSFPLRDPHAVEWPPVEDHLGWHEQAAGVWFLGLHVENGRISDDDGARTRTALRRLVDVLGTEVRLTPQQNVILTGVPEARRDEAEDILRAHGVTVNGELHPLVRRAMACPALPTCGLAVAESERVLPSLVRQLAVVVDELGLRDAGIGIRMTGCPNGCARPYLGDIGLVGTTLGKYDVFVGGDAEGTRLNELYAAAVRVEAICDVLRPLLEAFASGRRGGEAFGDWGHRGGVARLAQRFDPGGLRPLPVAVGA
jgi:sulfite reductase (ferredoxin)